VTKSYFNDIFDRMHSICIFVLNFSRSCSI